MQSLAAEIETVRGNGTGTETGIGRRAAVTGTGGKETTIGTTAAMPQGAPIHMFAL